jgi:hypothetical protein
MCGTVPRPKTRAQSSICCIGALCALSLRCAKRQAAEKNEGSEAVARRDDRIGSDAWVQSGPRRESKCVYIKGDSESRLPPPCWYSRTPGRAADW